MDKQAIKNEIDSLIQKLKERSTAISNIDKITVAEMAELQSTVDKLHQHISVLNYLKTHGASSAKEEEKSLYKAAIVPDTVEVKLESEKPVEVKDAPVDLFGGELPPVVAPEKPKAEKKTVKKEEKPVQVVSKIQKPKLDNLNSAIGLNDKFQFANELFEGSMPEYNIAIHQLNTAGTIESAMEYVESLQLLYNWDFENETVKRLLDLVDRRYS